MQHTRHNTIREMLADTGFVNVQELANKFGVTTETIRRDLEQMEADGVARRVRGGAVSLLPRTQQSEFESAYTLRKESFSDEKTAIARMAADMIDDGDTIIVSPGTTALEVAKQLKNKHDLTVITNSLPVAIELSDADGISVFCLGGFVRPDDYSVASSTSLDDLSMFNPTKLITGVGGINVRNGLTDYRMDESSILRGFFDKTTIAIGVADHSKFGKVARYNICPASRLDYLITSSQAPEDQVTQLREIGVRVRIAE